MKVPENIMSHKAIKELVLARRSEMLRPSVIANLIRPRRSDAELSMSAASKDVRA